MLTKTVLLVTLASWATMTFALPQESPCFYHCNGNALVYCDGTEVECIDSKCEETINIAGGAQCVRGCDSKRDLESGDLEARQVC